MFAQGTEEEGLEKYEENQECMVYGREENISKIRKCLVGLNSTKKSNKMKTEKTIEFYN